MERIWYKIGAPQPPAGKFFSSNDTHRLYTAVTNKDRRVEVFVVDGGGALRWAFQPWGQFMLSEWFSLGGLPLPFALPAQAQVAADVNADGRVEVFVFSDTHLWHKSQDHPGTLTPTGWGKWEALPLPPVAASVPVVAQNADGRLEVFAFGMGGKVPLNPAGKAGVWHIWQQVPGGDWLPQWEPLVLNSTWQLTSLCSCGAVARNAANISGRLEAFTFTDPPAGTSSELLHCWQTSPNGEWTDWYSLGTPPYLPAIDPSTGEPATLVIPASALSTPSVAVNSEGGLEVFVGVWNVVSHIWQSTPGSTWSAWDLLGDPERGGAFYNAQPAAILNPQTPDLELFLVGADSALYHRMRAPGGGWSDWESFGNPGDPLEMLELTIGAPSLAADFEGRIWAFMLGVDGQCYSTPNPPFPPPPPPPQLRTPKVEVNPFPVPLGKSESIHVQARDPVDGTALTGTTTILQPSHVGSVRFDPVATFQVPGMHSVTLRSFFAEGDMQVPYGHFVPDRTSEYQAVDYDLV